MTYYTFFHQKFDNGVNEVLSSIGINLMVSFQDIAQNMVFAIWQKSHIKLELGACYCAILMTC